MSVESHMWSSEMTAVVEEDFGLAVFVHCRRVGVGWGCSNECTVTRLSDHSDGPDLWMTIAVNDESGLDGARHL